MGVESKRCLIYGLLYEILLNFSGTKASYLIQLLY